MTEERRTTATQNKEQHSAETQLLVRRLGQRDPAALAALYDRFGGPVYSFVVRMTKDPGMAEEVTLDSFLHVWNEAHRFNSEQSVQSWLFTVARSRTIDRLRALRAVKRQHVAEAVDSSVARPDDLTETAERQRIVRAAMGSLPPNQRTALELAYYEGLSHSEIAERLGEPLGTVKTRIRQAMIVLRKALAPILVTA